jgi:hypothetical protein
MTRASLLCEGLVDEMEEPAWESLDRSLIGLGTKRVTRKHKEKEIKVTVRRSTRIFFLNKHKQ